MHLLPDDDRFLYLALDLAYETAAFASPNPAVGCVLVRQGELLACGAHRYETRDHAEIVALKQAALGDTDVRGATAYVTLEPCSHHGRTGPCANALIAAGIGRCVIATVDPNPLVSGQGLEKLRAAGIEVAVAEPTSGVAQAARQLNDAFAFAIQHGRPFVTLKSAISAEGRLAPPPSTRTTRAPFWLTGAAARVDVHALRHGADALLTGIGTVLADDPELTDRSGLPRQRRLLRTVLDSHLRAPLQSRLVQSAAKDVLLFCAEDASQARAHMLQAAGVEIVRLPSHQGHVSLPAALAALHDRAIRSVLFEAGASLNAALLAGDLVDRVVLYRAPLKLGPAALPFAQPAPTPEALLARLTRVEERRFPRDDGFEDLRIAGYLHDPWRAVPSVADAVL